jgi:phage-related minor tail protein
MTTEFKKGKKPGPGRPPGTLNKVTQEFRQTVQALLDENRSNVALWLSMVAEGTAETKPDPGKALDLLARLAEFAAPKLARTEVTGMDGGAIDHSLTVSFVAKP